MVRVTQVLEAHVLGAGDWLAASEVCELCRIDLQVVRELAALGLVTTRETGPGEWQVPATALARLRIVGTLMRDLGVNTSGAALAVELLEVQRELERRIRRLERLSADY
jgi:MerR HTH family regulatory protein